MTAEDDKPGAPLTAVISYSLWHSAFGGDNNVIGRETMINGQKATVVGVMPANFEFPTPVDIWVPLGQVSSEASYRDRGNHPGLRAQVPWGRPRARPGSPGRPGTSCRSSGCRRSDGSANALAP